MGKKKQQFWRRKGNSLYQRVNLSTFMEVYVVWFLLLNYSVGFLLPEIKIFNIIFGFIYRKVGFPGGSVGKESACSAGDPGRFNAWVGKIPWRRAWRPTPGCLPGESHGQRNLVGSSSQSHKDTLTEATEHACIQTGSARGRSSR